MTEGEMREAARVMALIVCVRALVEAHPDQEAIKEALEASRERFMASLQGVYQANQAPAELAQLSVQLEHHLWMQTGGRVGEAPGSPTPSNPHA